MGQDLNKFKLKNVCTITNLISFGIERRMKRDETYAKIYYHGIQNYFNKGYARKLDESEFNCKYQPIWYLLNFGVVSVHKPDKLRIVFDAAATVTGNSINSAL